MKTITKPITILLAALVIAACSQKEKSQTYIVSDWNIEVEGYSKGYIDSIREAYAVNTITQPTDQCAAATTVFTGSDGTYFMRFTSLQETDGEPNYKILVNNREVLVFTNPRTFDTGIPEYEPFTIVVNNIQLIQGDTIRVEFCPATNDLVPEGEAYGFARARWRDIVLEADEGR